MLIIKLQRVGRKHQSSFRLVVAEKRSKVGGPPVEDLGSYHPRKKSGTLEKERILHWLTIGAKPTATVHNLLVKEGILSGEKIKIKLKTKTVGTTGGKQEEKVTAEPQSAGAGT